MGIKNILYLLGEMLEKIPAVCITLDRWNPKRAVKAMDEIKSLGFKDPEFIDGVLGKELTDSQVRNIVGVRAYYELEKGRYVHEALSGKGSIGCYLSHLKAWHICRDMGVPIAIFEDDFVGVKDCKDKMEKSLKEAIRLNYNILRFQHHCNIELGEELLPCDSDLICKIGRTQGLAAYIMTPETADLLISDFNANKIEMHVDHYLDMFCFYHGLNHFCTKESLFDDPQVVSDISHNSIKRYNTNIFHYIVQKCVEKQQLIIFTILVLVMIYVLKPWRKTRS